MCVARIVEVSGLFPAKSASGELPTGYHEGEPVVARRPFNCRLIGGNDLKPCPLEVENHAVPIDLFQPQAGSHRVSLSFDTVVDDDHPIFRSR